MPIAWIMSGIPGAGKSSWIKSRRGVIVSADHFFIDGQGEYNFDPSRLKEAHDDCLYRYLHHLQFGKSDIFVDNTNIRVWEIAPYYRLAEVYKYTPFVIRVMCDPAMAAKRCIHNVPTAKVFEMSQSFDPLPPWWQVKYVWNNV